MMRRDQSSWSTNAIPQKHWKCPGFSWWKRKRKKKKNRWEKHYTHSNWFSAVITPLQVIFLCVHPPWCASAYKIMLHYFETFFFITLSCKFEIWNTMLTSYTGLWWDLGTFAPTSLQKSKFLNEFVSLSKRDICYKIVVLITFLRYIHAFLVTLLNIIEITYCNLL